MNNKIISYLPPDFNQVTIEMAGLVSNAEISTEGFDFGKLKDRIIAFVKRIKDFIKKLYQRAYAFLKRIVEKVIQWFSKDEKKIEEIKEVVEPVDLLNVYRQAILSLETRTVTMINQDGTLIDLDEYEKVVDRHLKDLEDEKGMDEWQSIPVNKCYEIAGGFIRYCGKALENMEDTKGIELEPVSKLFDFKTMVKIQRGISARGIAKDIEKIEDIVDTYTDELNRLPPSESFENNEERIENIKKARAIQDKLAYANSRIMTNMAKIQVYITITNFFRATMGLLRKGDVFGEPYKNQGPLLHVSTNGELSHELTPRFPGDMSEHDARQLAYDEILPKRISFANTVKECVSGIVHHVKEGTKYDEDKKQSYLVLYVYEGIPDQNTVIMKEKYVKRLISDWSVTHEVVAIRNNVKIKKKEKIKVWFKQQHDTVKTVYGLKARNVLKVIDQIETLEKY